MRRDLDSVARYLFAVLAAVLVVAIGGTYVFIGEVTAIKGTYVLWGTLIAAVLYRRPDEPGGTDRDVARIGRWATKVIGLLVVGAFLATYTTGTRFLAVVVALGVGYTVVAYQLSFGGSTRHVVPQLGMLFTVNPVTTYLSTGFYFGATDTLGHVRAVEVLLGSDGVSAINTVYNTYSSFPALHLLASAVRSFTGLPAYDSLFVSGIAVYATVVFVVFYLSRVLFSRSKAVFVAFVFSTLSVVHSYTTYFFPQTFATALFFFLFYAAVRRKYLARSGSLSVLAFLLVGGLTLAHHVTHVLVAGVLATLYAPSLLRVTRFGRRLDVNGGLPRIVPLLFAVVTGITYLVASPTTVLGYFGRFLSRQASDPTVSDTGGRRMVLGYGTDIPYHTPSVAVESLFHVDGLYFIALTALFVAGIVTAITHPRRYTRVAGVVLLGIGSGVAVLKTPLLSVVSRLSLPLTLFFSIIAGIGLWHLLLGDARRTLSEQTNATSLRRIALAGLIVVAGITGPLVAASDLYGLHAGPNLWETYSTPEQQVDFSEEELRELEAMVHFVDQRETDVTMLTLTAEAAKRFGVEDYSRPTSVTGDGIEAESALVYRTSWTDHQIGSSVGGLRTLSIADWWLQREIGATNKVYTTGGVGILWDEDVTLSNARGEDE